MWLGLALALVVALVAQPAWPAGFVQGILWFAGAWRMLLVPACVAAAAGLLVANNLAPGASWSRLRAAAVRHWRAAAAAAALAIGLFSFGYTSALFRGDLAARALVLLALQIMLFPGTPLAALALTAALALAIADARGRRAWPAIRSRMLAAARAAARAGRRAAAPAAAGAFAALLAAAIFPSAMQGWGRAEGASARRFNFYSSFFNYAISDDRIVAREGFELGKLGLVLPPGRSGSIVFRLERPPESLVLLRANFYNRRFDTPDPQAAQSQFPNAIELSTDEGQSFRPVLLDASVGEVVGSAPLDLTPLAGTARTYWLRFRATNTLNADVTVLPSLVVSTVADLLAAPDPTFPVVPYAAAIAALLCVAALRRGWSSPIAAAIGCTAAAVALVVAAWALPGGGYAPSASAGTTRALLVMRVALGAAVAGAARGARRWRGAAGSAASAGGAGGAAFPWLATACLLVGLVALDVRWQELVRVRYEFLLPDAQGYQAIAEVFPQKLAHYEGQRTSRLLDALYDAGFDGRASVPAVFYAGGNNGREPLWPAALRLTFDLLGSSAFHTRLTSLGFGVLVAALTCWTGWRVLHPLAGVTAGLLLAFNHPQAVNSVAGLREELVTSILLLLFAALALGVSLSVRPGVRQHPARGVSWRRALAAGAAGGVLVLVRADMLVLAGPAITLGALLARWGWRRWIAALALMGALAGPMYAGYWFTHGDPFYPGTYGATVNRNLEFPERMGTPGFPSPEEYAGNWAAGPSISPTKYFFGYHTPAQFVDYTVRGFLRIFPTILFERQPLQLGLFWAGMGLLLLTRRWVVPFALVFCLVPFYSFLAGVPNPWVFPGRYAHHALPFAVMAAGFALWFLPLQLARRWRALRTAAGAGGSAEASTGNLREAGPLLGRPRLAS